MSFFKRDGLWWAENFNKLTYLYRSRESNIIISRDKGDFVWAIAIITKACNCARVMSFEIPFDILPSFRAREYPFQIIINIVTCARYQLVIGFSLLCTLSELTCIDITDSLVWRHSDWLGVCRHLSFPLGTSIGIGEETLVLVERCKEVLCVHWASSGTLAASCWWVVPLSFAPGLVCFDRVLTKPTSLRVTEWRWALDGRYSADWKPRAQKQTNNCIWFPVILFHMHARILRQNEKLGWSFLFTAFRSRYGLTQVSKHTYNFLQNTCACCEIRLCWKFGKAIFWVSICTGVCCSCAGGRTIGWTAFWEGL